MSGEKCEGCGISLGREMPEDACAEEMLCDRCVERLERAEAQERSRVTHQINARSWREIQHRQQNRS